MMGFIIITKDREQIRFNYYADTAPVTCNAFHRMLPFTRRFHHARISGEEIWMNDVPRLGIIQQNASIFIRPGEVVFGPSKPKRARTANCLGIYYGAGRGLDAANIFARVTREDLHKLIDLGMRIWTNGNEEVIITTSEW